MITFFRIFSTFQVLSILVILLLVKLPFGIGELPTLIPEVEWQLTGQKMAEGNQIYKDIWTSTSPIVALIYYLVNTLIGKDSLFFELTALILVFLQAWFFNNTCANRKLYIEKTYVPALIYILIMSVSFDLQKLSPPLISTTFILFALNSVLKQTETSQINTNHSFEIGFFIGLGSLTHFPVSILVVWAIISLLLYSKLNLRQFLLLFLGFALPFLFFGLYYSFFDSLGEFRDQWLESIFRIKAFSFSNFYNSLFVFMFSFVLMVLGILRIFSISRYNSYQNRAHQIVLILAMVSLVAVILADNTATYQFAILVPVIAFFATAFILHLKGTYLPEVIFIVFLTVNLVVQRVGYSSLLGMEYNHLGSIRVDESVAEKYRGKKILITGSDNSAYKDATSATKYLNWSLSRFELQNPDNYQSIISINDTFRKEKPEVILDNAKVFGEVFKILPQIKDQYKAVEPNVYYLKK
ncbi:hypothetical protein SAMN06298216_0498 [Spirosomataceae bacterium TFI 002]|nr:hypothetical protein SAMN06298216_0498 [Spirosomataceae bacterium TFI 002]